jgi:DNA-binding SARP family transcriptional activator
MMAMAWVEAHGGEMAEARRWTQKASERAVGQARREWLTEFAAIETAYGSEEAASSLIEELLRLDLNPALKSMARMTASELALRRLAVGDAIRLLPDEPTVPVLELGFLARFHAVHAHIAVRSGAPGAFELVTKAIEFAEHQGAGLWALFSQTLLLGLAGSPSTTVKAIHRRDPRFLSMAAELVIEFGNSLDSESTAAILEEAWARPERWRTSVRRVASDPRSPNRLFAARVLDVIGEPADVRLLRSIGRSQKGLKTDAALGRGLARRLAKPVMVDDLGRVEILIGTERVAGSELRRKVLALLTFLLTRPKYSATRDEVVDAIWPDLDPDVAINSVNQTVYFLRRVFEPGYKDDLSAGYVRHDSDVIWLDDTLISSRSRKVREIIDGLAASPTLEGLAELSRMYIGHFALDFMYEEWAVPFRDALHVSYLHIVEEAVARDMAAGHHSHGIELARRALDVDRGSETLQASLVRLLQLTGAHSAAAEQYGNYASYLRAELGIEPPPMPAVDG